MRYWLCFPRGLGGILFALLSLSNLPAQTSNVVRVMTANLTSGNFQKYETPGLDILKGLNPDVVAIQEFNFSNNTPADFRVMLDTTFGTNFSYFRETNGYNIPNGIISRYPIVDAGSWGDSFVPDRGFAWARIALPGTNDLYVVSVHLYGSGSAADRNAEATAIKSQIQANFPASAWVIVAGDFNTSARTEAAVTTFKTFLSDDPIPTDAESGGDPDTNQPRNSPYDYVLPSFSLTNALTAVVLPSHSFSNGLVFDSRVYNPLGDVPPVVSGDSGATGMQHMGVVKDFSLLSTGTNAIPPSITAQPQSQTVAQGSNATFSVTAAGTSPLNYQWRFNGTNISGATNTSYSRTNVQPGDAGDYSVVVTNSAGSTTSSNATLTVNSSPVILTQPQSQAVSAGQDATFTVTASGATPLSYQWRFNTTNLLAGATASSFTRTNAQSADAGNYSVIITNSAGSVTSVEATLTVVVASPSIIAQWNFNSPTPDANTTTGATTPSVGSGAASLAGGATATFATGDPALDPAGANDNSAWNTSGYPLQGTGNKTAGARFNVSTVGRQNISIWWSERMSNTGSKYVRLQYSTNGINFVDFPSATVVNTPTTFEAKTNNLAAVPAVNNNANFAFQIVAEFESTAANTANANYVPASSTSTYGTNGTIRFDMVTVSGTAIPTNNPPPGPATLSGAGFNANLQFRFTVTGQSGSNYVVQASTNLSVSNWISLATNVSPYTFTDTNAAAFVQRFYRAWSLP